MTTDTLAAVLWDMDGTLIDSEPHWLRAELAMLARFGIEMSPATQNMLVGTGLRDAATHFQHLGVEMSVDEIIAEWVSEVEAGILSSGPEWRPGARELLSDLQREGVPCALVTMSVRTLADAIVSLLPDGTFAAIIAGDEVSFEKPHPEPYLLGASALDVPIERCLALEDSPTGLRSAAASGAVAVGIPNLVPLETAPAHALLPTLSGVSAPALSELYSELRNEHGLTVPSTGKEPTL